MTPYDSAIEDFRWLLSNVVGLDDVLAAADRPEFDAETVDQLLTAASDFITGAIAPINEASDRVGVSLRDGRVITPPGWKEAWRAWRDNGWPGLGAPEAQGGQDAPFIVQACVATMLGGADLAFAMVSASARAACAVLGAHAEPELRQLCVERLATGEWAATIVITEPQAGSDVGLITTRAARRPDGHFALTGQKIFISGGDHDLTEQILHVVLARIEGAGGGTKGLSLFLVPSRLFDADATLGARNGVVVGRIEEKLGLHGSATCVMDFDNADGVLIGQEGAGLQTLFVMMNELRIEVALSAIGIAASATAHAIAYSQERLQGRSASVEGSGPAPIGRHPDVQRMIAIMRALTDGGRALILETARLLDLSKLDKEPIKRREAGLLAAWLLPICKARLSDDVVEVANLGIQVRGGHGYVRESGAEQFLRDGRVLPIYEGANGIQAIDLVTRKLQRDGGEAFRLFTAAIDDDLARSEAVAGEDADLKAIRDAVRSGKATLERLSDSLLACGADQESAVLGAASAYLSLAGRVTVAWMWLRMAIAAAAAPDDEISRQKRALAGFYAHYFEPEFHVHAARVSWALGATPSMLPKG